jgi:DinB superfamily
MTMFQPGLQRFRQTRQRTLSLVRDLAQDELDRRPAPNSWSVGEVLDHLLLAETFFRKEIHELIARRKEGRSPLLVRGFRDLDISVGPLPRGLFPWLSVPLTLTNLFVPAFVRDFLVRSRLIPARHPTAATPRRGRRAADLRAELAASLAETEALFQANPSIDFRALRYVHPVLGNNNVLDLLRIVTLHEERHQERIAELVRPLSGTRRAAPVT